MKGSLHAPTSVQLPLVVAAGEDRFGEIHGVDGINTMDFKVSAQDSQALFILEIINHTKGGPARHLHYEQEEWFYVVEGVYVFEAGENRFHLKPGNSLLVPKKVPHVWAFTGETRGRLLVTVNAGWNIEAFFREAAKTNAVPGQYPEAMESLRHGTAWTASASRSMVANPMGKLFVGPSPQQIL